MIPRDTHDGAFYRAVLALHQDLFSLAQQVQTSMYPDHLQREGNRIHPVRAWHVAPV